MKKSATSTKERIDQFGGKLIYRSVSVVPFGFGLFTLKSAHTSYLMAAPISAIILAAISALLFWGVKWCWSKNRTLGEFIEANS